jgi:peptide subunit release factor 1 (eRF1)
MPNIFRLVEIRDNYDRYVVLFATEESARILRIDIGAITQEVWKSRPELRHRASHERSKDQFEDHRRERMHQFIRDQIRMAERVMAAGGYTHLILAGAARLTAAIRQALPKRLALKLVDTVPAGARERLPEVVAATVESFLEYEESQSLAVAERLFQEVRTEGLAVAGTRASLAALASGQCETLVLARDYRAEPASACLACGSVGCNSERGPTCPNCGGWRQREVDLKEEMVRLAERFRRHIEVVEHSDLLMQLGGVGCFLRYAAPTNRWAQAA